MPAYWFAGTDELVAALRLCDDPASWRQPARRTRLVADQADAWLIETAEPIAGLAPSNPQGLPPFRPAARLDAPSLIQAVPLLAQPLSRPSPLTYIETDADGFADAARANLMLDRDQMRYAAIGDGRLLLAVEQMSQFLIRKWATAGDRTLYQPDETDARLLLPLGCAYPLADKFRFQPGGELDRWLVERDGPWRHLRVELRDIYERIALDTAGLAATELRPDGEVPRVTVALRLEPDQGQQRPELWLLPDERRAALHELLGEAGEAELHGLHIAVVSDQAGSRWFVIAERRRAPGGLPLPLRGAEPFYARLAEEHLYLPIGLRLAPVLARRALIDALRLSDSHLTLLAGGDGGLRLMRIPRAALAPLPSVVDYFAGEEAGALADLMSAVRIDFDLAPEEPEEVVAPEPSWWDRLRRVWRR